VPTASLRYSPDWSGRYGMARAKFLEVGRDAAPSASAAWVWFEQRFRQRSARRTDPTQLPPILKGSEPPYVGCTRL